MAGVDDGEGATLGGGPAPGSGAASSSEGPQRSLAGAASSGARPSVVGGRYEIVALLGAGGMGTVYRARDLELDEVVALKVLRKDAVSTASLERFRREVKLARRVTHKNVARTFDIGEHDGERFLTMELVEGESLSSLLRRKGRSFSLTSIVEILSGVCEGLAAAHDAGVIHRDLKPDNILVGPSGRVVITDFGIARAAQDVGSVTLGTVVGTPAYMAPEQVQGGEVDARADLYALGVILFELLTGELPFKGDSVFALAIARLQAPAPDPRQVRPDLPSALADLTLCLLARDPTERPSRSADVAVVLSGVTLPMVAAPGASVRSPASTLSTPFARISTKPAVTPSGAPPAASSTSQTSKTVAVLPFANQGPADEAYLAEGIAQDIADTLSTTRGLRVRSALSARYHGEIDARAVGAELGVQVLVVGSVRRLGPRARISARAISTADGFQIWAGRFDSDAGELLVVSDEVAREVAKALTVELREGEARGAIDPAAVDVYLRARHILGGATDGAEISRGVELLEEARARAPEDAAIWSALALGYARMWFGGDPSAEGPARDAAERAIAIAPNRGEPLLARGMFAYQLGRFAPAIRDLKRSLFLSPSLPDAHHLLGSLQLEIGPIEVGAQRLRTALLLEPRLLRSAVELARYHAFKGEFDTCFEVLDRYDRDNEGRFAWIPRARMCLWEGNPERVARIRARAEAEGVFPVVMMFGLMESKDEASMVALLDGSPVGALARASVRGRALRSQALAEMTALVDHVPQAMGHLREAVAAELVDLTWMELCPALRHLREEPGFSQLLELVRGRADRLRAIVAE